MKNSSPNKVKIGLIQRSCSDQVEQNMDETFRMIREAAKQGAQIICLQELYRSQYFCQVENTDFFSLAEEISGPSTNRLCGLAKKLNVVIIAPIFEKRTEGMYHNSAVVIDADGSMVGNYRKMHIPDDPCFYEKFYFTPGDTGFKSFTTRHGTIGVLICWDQWFPEAARLTALSGAQIIFYPTAIGFQNFDADESAKQHQAWETIQKSHAIANGVFVAAVNRVGKENALEFWGQSFVCDPFGEILVCGSRDREEILIVECDLTLIEQTRQGWPFLRDRRTDAYKGLNRLFIDPS